ncbi:MAG TPA: hypothetical protein VMF52_16880 [Steroidobacteraceae bacterium]|nr:hypothetical protein [Steroidobacteraceae bacterium]
MNERNSMLSLRFTPKHFFLSCLLLAAAVVASVAHAAPPAGTSIGNQASATYSDDTNVTRTVTSNTVTTIVQQVASFTLTADGDRRGNAGGQVAFPHTLTNTGNGADTFALTQTEAGAFTFASVQIYADANGDGVPDNNTNISTTGELAAGAAFRFVVVGTVPGSAVSGNVATITVQGRSGFLNSLTHTNADQVTVTTQAVIGVTKAIDLAYGPSPSSGVRTYTLTYTNTGNTTATNLVLTDTIAAGLTYEAGTGRWSVTGALAMTDANSDDQGGVVYVWDGTTKKITVTIASVAAGQSGTVTFGVRVNTGEAPGVNTRTANTAQFAYNNGAGNITAVDTNTVQYTVQQSAAVTVSSDTKASATQAATVNFTNVVTNTGNGLDTFNLTLLSSTFPAGTTLQLFRADGLTPLTDTNNDGIPDTGPLAASGTLTVIVKATLPANAPAAPGNGPYAVNVRGTSVFNTAVTGQGTDTLTTIAANSVDLTNNAAGFGNPGYGAGPEGAAVYSRTVAPGATTRFTLVAANATGVPDSFDLTASRLANFSDLTFPAGWTVVFHDANGNVIANTGVIAANSTKTFYADVTAPANATTGFDLYFRAKSPSTTAVDIVFDAVAVGTVRSLTLTPNNLGQAAPGGTVVYTHMLVNTGTSGEGTGSSTVALAAASNSGFTSVVYWDKNNNGTLDPTDPIVTSVADFTGGTNGASTAAGLDPGEVARLFVKVSAAPGAAAGVTDTTTLTATVTGTIGGQAAPTGIFATDTTAIVGSNLTLVKMQAIDANCDGTPEGSYATSPLGTNAVPGACIRYQITATNAGVANITALLLNDFTPANTTYHGSGAAAAVTVGSVTTVPGNGSTGAVQATVGTLTPGQTAVLTFGVRIDP